MLLTNKALYNLRPSWQSSHSSHHYHCRRRVHLGLIETISIPSSLSISTEFIIHIPSEYDYRFKSSWHLHIANTIADQCTVVRGKRVKVKRLEDDVATAQAVVSRKMAKGITPEIKRKMLLQKQQVSAVDISSFEYRRGDVLSGETMDSLPTTIAKARSYALKLADCAGFCLSSGKELDEIDCESEKFEVAFKRGPIEKVGADKKGHWHSFVLAVAAADDDEKKEDDQ